MNDLDTELQGMKAQFVFIQHKIRSLIKPDFDKNINNTKRDNQIDVHNLFAIKLRNQLELSSLVSGI